ncbi:PQQ-binding-like beta-propeller repeat protein [bacterium]|nr:PQQ-binding-like beta-propeller repeat protein [bacterium]
MKRFVLFSIGLAMLLAAACSSPETPQPQEEQTLPVSSFFGPQPRPAGVDAALWRQLVSEFDRVLQAQGTARRVSVPPTGSGSEVGDLWVTPDGGGGADMSWSYRNQGDLNLDGTVSIADLTPIGVHYLNSSTAGDWIEHQIADADANGVVSITDLTPIGINYGGKVAGYEIQMRFLSATEWTHASWVPFISSAPGSTQPPRYSFHLAAPLPNLVYRVVPTANADEPYQYGVASNGVLYSLASVPFWNQQQGGDARNGQSKVAGPLTETVAWTLELAGTAAHVTSPVADAYGTTYSSLAAPNPGMMQPGPGTLYAVNRFGQLEWSYRSGKSLSPPLLSVDENVYVQEDGGSILCFSRDGHLRWKRELAETSHGAWWQPVIADNGLLIAPDAEDRLNAIEPDGSLRWSVALAAAPAAAPTIFDPVLVLPLEDQTIGGNALTDGTAMTAFAFDSRWPVVYDDALTCSSPAAASTLSAFCR